MQSDSNPYLAPETPAADLSVAGALDLAPKSTRVVGYLIDFAVHYGLLYLVLFMLMDMLETEATGLEPEFGPVIVACLVFTAFLLAQWTGISLYGRSFGKLLAGSRIVRDDGTPAGFVHGLIIRHWVIGALFMTCNIARLGPWIWLLDCLAFVASKEHQALHDRLARTVVVTASGAGDVR